MTQKVTIESARRDRERRLRERQEIAAAYELAADVLEDITDRPLTDRERRSLRDVARHLRSEAAVWKRP